MSRHLNRVTLIGVIGSEPTLNASVGQTAVCKFSVGVTESYKGRDGRQVNETELHPVIVLGKQAEVLYPVLGAGKRIYVEGKLQNRERVIQNITVAYVNIKAERVIVLGHDRDVEKEAEREEIVANG